MDCEITKCFLYDKDCFFRTILVKKPDPTTGCSYFRSYGRKIKKGKVELDADGNPISKGKRKEKVVRKRRGPKKEENSLQEIM